MTQIVSISPAGLGKLVRIERIIDWQRDAYRQIINEQPSEIINLIIHLPVLLPAKYLPRVNLILPRCSSLCRSCAERAMHNHVEVRKSEGRARAERGKSKGRAR